MTKLRSVTSLPTATQSEPESLADAVRGAIGDMSQWSHLADRANAKLAIMIAEQIDAAKERFELAREADVDERLARWCQVAETLDSLGPKLHAILRDLGATPAGRKGITVGERKSGRLAALRGAAK